FYILKLSEYESRHSPVSHAKSLFGPVCVTVYLIYLLSPSQFPSTIRPGLRDIPSWPSHAPLLNLGYQDGPDIARRVQRLRRVVKSACKPAPCRHVAWRRHSQRVPYRAVPRESLGDWLHRATPVHTSDIIYPLYPSELRSTICPARAISRIGPPTVLS